MTKQIHVSLHNPVGTALTQGTKPFSFSALQLLESDGVRPTTHSQPSAQAGSHSCAETQLFAVSHFVRAAATGHSPPSHPAHKPQKLSQDVLHSELLRLSTQLYSLQPRRRRCSKSPNLMQRRPEQKAIKWELTRAHALHLPLMPVDKINELGQKTLNR